MTHQTETDARRQRYAIPLYAIMRQNGWDGERTEQVVHEMDLVLEAVLTVADAELAERRAANLHEAADAIEAEQHRLDDEENERLGGLSESAAAEHVAIHRAAGTLRHMAAEAAPAAVSAAVAPPTNQATAEAALAAVETALCDTLLPDAREEALDRLMTVLPPTTDRAAEPVCICGHPDERHFEDVCQTCGCGDYLEPQDAAEVIARWRQAALKARADRAVVLTEPERKMLAFALEITQEEIHARSLDLADDDKAALVSLRRMADETDNTQTTPEACAHCGQPIRRVTGTLAAWWVHDPGGNTVCDWARAAHSPRATPKTDDEPAAGVRQDETCTNCNGSGLDPRYNGEFACPDCPAAGARQDGAES
ncbi:hypothetical protein ACPCSD_14735 [Streptomyces griseoincarnatus]